MTIVYGNRYQVKSGLSNVAEFCVVPMSSGVSVIFWRDSDRSLRAKVLTHGATSITGAGTETTLVSSGLSGVNLCASRLDSSRILVVSQYKAPEDVNHYLSFWVVTVSGELALSIGTMGQSTEGGAYIGCVALSSSLAAIIYTDGSDRVKGTKVSISGTSITGVTAFMIEDTDSIHNAICRLTDTRCMVAYQNELTSGIHGAVIDMSGTPSVSTITSFHGTRSAGFHLDGFESDKAIFSYQVYSSKDAYSKTIKDQGGTSAPTVNSNINQFSVDRRNFWVATQDGDNAVVMTRDETDYICRLDWIEFPTDPETTLEVVSSVDTIVFEPEPDTGHWLFTGNIEQLPGTTSLYICSYEDYWYGASPDEITIYVRLFSTTPAVSFTAAIQGAGRQLDADLADNYLYICALIVENDNTPAVLKFAADLSEDATIVYTTGSGTEAEVYCSDESSSKIWTAGDYGAVKVAVTVNSGTSWDDRNPSVASGVVARPFTLGPHDDNFLYDFVRPGVAESGGGSVYHTSDGSTWSQVYVASGNFTANCIDNAIRDRYEVAMGAFNGKVLYTPDHFSTVYDITYTLPNLEATDIILPF